MEEWNKQREARKAKKEARKAEEAAAQAVEAEAAAAAAPAEPSPEIIPEPTPAAAPAAAPAEPAAVDVEPHPPSDARPPPSPEPLPTPSDDDAATAEIIRRVAAETMARAVKPPKDTAVRSEIDAASILMRTMLCLHGSFVRKNGRLNRTRAFPIGWPRARRSSPSSARALSPQEPR